MIIEKILSEIDDESFFFNSSFSDMANKLMELTSMEGSTSIDALLNEFATLSVDTTEIIPKKEFSISLGRSISNNSEHRIDEIIKYIKHRCKETASEIMRARYSHVIWLYSRKNDDYPKQAIKLYISFSQKDEVSDLNKLIFLSYAFKIALSIKDNIDPIIAIILNIMNLTDSLDAISLGIRIIYEYRNKFKKAVNVKLFSHCYLTIKNQFNSGENCFFLIETMDQIISMLQAINTESQLKWYELKGEIFESMAENKDELIQLNFLKDAIHSYKRAKSHDRENNCKFKYEKIWKSYGGDNFPKQGLGDPFNEIMNELIRLTKEKSNKTLKLLKLMPIDATVAVLLSPLVIPKITSIQEAVQNRGKPIFMEIAKVIVFDEHGNSPEPLNSDEQEFKYLFYQEYGIHMVRVDCFLKNLLKPLIIENKLETKSFIHMLTTRSLLKELTYNREETWIEAITPAINYYFSQISKSPTINSKTYIDFSLSIDSLVLKLEGILRDIFSMRGTSPKKVTGQKTEEIDLNNLLNHEFMLQIYDENHVAFLKYILVEQLGLNLRNVVAHALKTGNGIYNESVMNYVFVCLVIIVFGIKSKTE